MLTTWDLRRAVAASAQHYGNRSANTKADAP
jgi:hypothetical protein